MQKTIRWGILGTGQIAHAFAVGLRDAPGTELAAVGSRNENSALAFASEFGIARHYNNYEALAADPLLDVIYIATPHPLHAENALMCLRAGKAVLCEKPFTMNRQEAEDVVALARKNKLFLMEAMWTRYLPAIQEAKRLLEAGAIGAPWQIQADFGFAADVGDEHRLRSKQLGGGALLDVGIYPLSLASYFLGEISEVRAQATLCETGVDTQTTFSLRHRNGGLSSCMCSTVARSPVTLTISGSRGTIQINAPFFKSQSVTVTNLDGEANDIALPYLGNGYTHEAIEVGRCLQLGLTESSLMPLDETLSIMGWLDATRAQIGLSYPADTHHQNDKV